VASGAILSVLAVVIMGLYLWIYPAGGFSVALGWDTAEYVWRTRLAQEVGVAHVDDAVPSIVPAKSGRPGYPVISATLSSVSGVEPLRVAAVIPPAVVAAIALAAGAFVSSVLRRPPWQLAVVTLFVGLSPFMVSLMDPEGYVDNLMAAAVFMAATVPVALALQDRAALIPAVVLFGMGGVIHWTFLQLVSATLLLTAAFLLPGSLRRWRSGARLLDTPAARLGQIVVGGALFAVGTLYGFLGDRLPRLQAITEEFLPKLVRDIPRYLFPFTLPLAALGVGALAWDAREPAEHTTRVRFTLAFLLSWCLVVLGGVVANAVFGVPIPSHRFLAFALAVPVLGALGVIWLGGLASRVALPVGAFLIGSLVVLSVVLTEWQWARAVPWVDAEKMSEAGVAAAYLDAAQVGRDRPVVFVVSGRDWAYAGLMVHMLRAALPPDRMDDVHLFAGSPQDYLDRRPRRTGVSTYYFSQMRHTYALDPVALVLPSFNVVHFQAWVDEHPQSRVAPSLAIVRGPVIDRPLPPEAGPIGRFPPIGLGILAVASLAVLALVGLGWAVTLVGSWLRPIELLALSPAVGIGTLVLGGVVFDRLGLRLSAMPGALLPLLVAAGGWAAFAVVSRARARRRA